MNKLVTFLIFLIPFTMGLIESLEMSCPSYVGMSSDGKIFFADKDISRNWTEAQDYCKECNLMLATITSPEQNEFLIEKLFLNESLERYWTLSRENRETYASLSWHDTGEVVGENIFQNFADATGNTPYQNCGMYELKYSDGAWMVLKPCLLPYGTLCMVNMTDPDTQKTVLEDFGIKI